MGKNVDIVLFIDRIVHNAVHDLEDTFTQADFKQFTLFVNREEIHRIIYRCAMLFWEQT